MRVLIVEDSWRLRASLGVALRSSGYAVDETGDGAEGWWLVEANPYDAIVLDILLPGLSGLDLLARMRQAKNPAPVLLLTAKDTVEDRVRGLQAGADDYLVKPFALEELLARVEVLCRRKHGRASGHIVLGDLEIDTTAKTVRRAGQAVTLTAREYRLLILLASRQGEVLSRQEIEAHIFDERTELSSNVVDSTVCLLRRKLWRPEEPPRLQTRRGHGYVLE
jgi:DNA-binding response OmpR family regulator